MFILFAVAVVILVGAVICLGLQLADAVSERDMASEAIREIMLECRDVDRWCAEFPQSADTARFINHRIQEIAKARKVYVRKIEFPSYTESSVAADSRRWAPCGVYEVRALRDEMRKAKEAQ